MEQGIDEVYPLPRPFEHPPFHGACTLKVAGMAFHPPMLHLHSLGKRIFTPRGAFTQDLAWWWGTTRPCLVCIGLGRLGLVVLGINASSLGALWKPPHMWHPESNTLHFHTGRSIHPPLGVLIGDPRTLLGVHCLGEIGPGGVGINASCLGAI